jgi:hypothetical protein
VTKSYIPALNAHARIDIIPAEVTIQRKRGRPIGSKDKNPQNRKEQNNVVGVTPAEITDKILEEIVSKIPKEIEAIALSFNLRTRALVAPLNSTSLMPRLPIGRCWVVRGFTAIKLSSTMHQCLKYIENDKQRRIDGDVKSFGVHEIKFNDAQYFLPKPATAPSRPTRKVSQKHFNKGPKIDTSSREEEEVKFNFKPRDAQA